VRTKNRMDPDVDEHPIYAGYRDVSLNLRFRSEEAMILGLDGHICELRLVLMPIISHYQVRPFARCPPGGRRCNGRAPLSFCAIAHRGGLLLAPLRRAPRRPRLSRFAAVVRKTSDSERLASCLSPLNDFSHCRFCRGILGRSGTRDTRLTATPFPSERLACRSAQGRR